MNNKGLGYFEEWAAISSQFMMTLRAKRPKSALPLEFKEHGALIPGMLFFKQYFYVK